MAESPSSVGPGKQAKRGSRHSRMSHARLKMSSEGLERMAMRSGSPGAWQNLLASVPASIMLPAGYTTL